MWKVVGALTLQLLTCSAERCASHSGFSPVEVNLLKELKELNVYGVNAGDIVVSRKTSIDATSKIVITDASAAVTSKTTGGKLEISVGSCAGAKATGEGTNTTGAVSLENSASWNRVGTMLFAVMAAAHVDQKASMAMGALLMAHSAIAADANCANFVKIDIFTPSTSANMQPAPKPSVPSTSAKMQPAPKPSVPICKNSSLTDTAKPKQGIFDSPSKAEMLKVVAAFKAFNLGSCGGGVANNKLRSGETSLIFTPAPLPKPDRKKILDLFGTSTLATNQKASPSAIWGGIMTTYISRIDMLWPKKSEALAYLDGTGARPGRYAKVNVAFGQCSVPYFKEFKVGPLDGTIAISAMPNGDHAWGSRPREGNEMRALKLMTDIILNEAEFQTLTKESFGGVHGIELNNHELAPPGRKATDRLTIVRIDYAIQGTWRGKDMCVLPLSFSVDGSNGDPSMWVAKDFYYNKQGPFTRDQLLKKYKDGTLNKVIIPKDHWVKLQDQVFPARGTRKPRPTTEIPGPRTYMPAGNRYTVNGRTIKWMDWEFHAGYNFRAGTSFHDIKFKGQRIAYEMSLSEVFLTYSANDPVGGNVIFFDATFGNGEYREMIRDIDCPDYATYIDNTWWAAPGGAQDAKRATCIFESWNSGGPMWRRGGPFVSGIKDETLSVRTMLTNGNYDYSCTFTFNVAGVLRVDLTSTGFLQTHYFSPNDPPSNSMAYRLHDYIGGSLHDHTFGFKVDFDVNSKENTFQTIKYKWGDTKDALNEGRPSAYNAKPPYMLWDKARYVQKTNHPKETRMDVDPKNPGTWLFGDLTKKNKWGNPRMYKLFVNDAHALAGVPDDHIAMKKGAASFTKNFLTVTQYKEEEQDITGHYDLNRLDDPQVDFKSFVNDESIAQKDLVAWVALSAMHLPHSEDFPMTNNLKHGLTIAPYNFFDENPTMDMPNFHRMMEGEVGAKVAAMRGKSDLPKGATCIPQDQDCTMEFHGVF